ncbi:MAG: acyl carrier protein [Myxococcota bacterium]
MAAKEVLDQVIRLVAETIEEASGRAVDLTPESELLNSGLVDSLAVLQLFTKLQEAFEVELDVDDLTETTFGTPSAIANLIEERS